MLLMHQDGVKVVVQNCHRIYTLTSLYYSIFSCQAKNVQCETPTTNHATILPRQVILKCRDPLYLMYFWWMT